MHHVPPLWPSSQGPASPQQHCQSIASLWLAQSRDRVNVASGSVAGENPEGCDSSTSLPSMAGGSIKAGETSAGGGSTTAGGSINGSDSVSVDGGFVAVIPRNSRLSSNPNPASVLTLH